MKKLLEVSIISILLFVLSVGISFASCSVSLSQVTGTISSGSYTITISGGVGTRTISFATLGAGSNNVKAERLRQALQNLFDVRIPLSNLPLDDPDKLNDPNRTDLFWSDSNGDLVANLLDATHLTGRACEVRVTVIGTGGSATIEITLQSTT